MIIEKEKAYFIGIMVIDMKEIGKMVNLKEKEYLKSRRFPPKYKSKHIF